MKIISHRSIIAAVAAAHGMAPKDMLQPTRAHAYSHPRQMAMLIMRENLKRSRQRIAAALGLSDHTTVIHGVEAARERIARDADTRRIYDDAMTRIMEGNNV